MKSITLSQSVEIPETSWCHPSLTLEKSPIHGTGVFTKEPIERYSIVFIWGGVIIRGNGLKANEAVRHTTVAIAPETWLSAQDEGSLSLDDYVNHSCNPNIGLISENVLVAINTIEIDEELTADYCTWLDDDSYVMKRTCNCGGSNCRSTIRGSDWRLPCVMKNLLPFYSPFLKHRAIGLLSSDS